MARRYLCLHRKGKLWKWQPCELEWYYSLKVEAFLRELVLRER